MKPHPDVADVEKTTLRQRHYLDHAQRWITPKKGRPESKFEVLRGDVIDEKSLKSFQAEQAILRAKMQMTSLLQEAALKAGKTLDAEAIKRELDGMVERLGLIAAPRTEDFNSVAEAILDRIAHWQPDSRIPDARARLLFLVHTDDTAVPSRNAQPDFKLKDTGAIIPMKKNIFDDSVSDWGWNGREHGVAVILPSSLSRTKSAIESKKRVLALSQQLQEIFRAFENGDFFERPPSKPARLQIIFTESHIEDDRPAEAPPLREE